MLDFRVRTYEINIFFFVHSFVRSLICSSIRTLKFLIITISLKKKQYGEVEKSSSTQAREKKKYIINDLISFRNDRPTFCYRRLPRTTIQFCDRLCCAGPVKAACLTSMKIYCVFINLCIACPKKKSIS